MNQTIDLVIVGAGAAGLSAANAAQEMGLSVVILDEQPEPGGQIYRSISRIKDQRLAILGDDYAKGRSLLDVLAVEAVTLIDSATVWNIDADGRVYYSRQDTAAVIEARYIIVATGAIERPMPFPGWELPGVMTAGAAQILLKSSSVVPGAPTVLAGSGPLLLLLAVQYLRSGFEIEALVETTPGNSWRRVLPHVIGAAKAHAYLRKGLAYLSEIKKHEVTHIKEASALRALGDTSVNALEFETSHGTERIDCQTLLIHNGVVPNVQLSRLLGIEHQWDKRQRYWFPKTGIFGRTSLEHIGVAGDGAGIGGAEIAAIRGYLAGLGAAQAMGRLSEEAMRHLAADKIRELKKFVLARPFIDALYVHPEYLNPPDETIVCRCEEVSAASVREFVDLGCLGPNQTKTYGRCGMGPCQGRLCGLTVAEVIAAKRQVDVKEVGYYRVRPPIKPVTLAELATIETTETKQPIQNDDAEVMVRIDDR